ncbi:MAG: RDD family protein, partial [Betaproteobacteria bacterium]|nr:RDD family protein [Betaproteobacteria bacterium]
MTPGIARRLASVLYEALLVLAVAFFAGSAFYFASRGAPLEGWLLRAHQAFLIAVFAAYFLWCWLRGGQTLAMKAWRIRLIEVTPRKA